MKKILLVGGCSFTDPDFHSDIHPEMVCDWHKWPELVADELDMECVNLAICGSGNERIYSTLSDYLTQPSVRFAKTTFISKRHLFDKKYEFTMTNDLRNIGLVVAAWSQGHRRDWSERRLVKRVDKRDLWTNINYDDKGDLYYWILKSLRYQYAYQNLCKQLNVPYVQFQMLSLWRAYIHFKIEELGKDTLYWEREMKNCIFNTGYNELINKHFLGWPGDVISDKYWNEKSWTLSDCLNRKDKISDEDVHPNKQGHEKLAEQFLKHLHEKNIIS